MITKFIDANGLEQSIDSIAYFISQVEAENIIDSTMIYCSNASWKQASTVEDYISIKSRLNNALQKSSIVLSEYNTQKIQESEPKNSRMKMLFANRLTPWIFTFLAILIICYSETALVGGDVNLAERIIYLIGQYLFFLCVGAAIAQKILFKSIQQSNFISFATVFLVAAIIHTFIAYEDNKALKSFVGEIAPYMDNNATSTSSNTNESYSNWYPAAQNYQLIKEIIKQHLDALAAASSAYQAATEQLQGALEPLTITDKAKAFSFIQKVDKYEEAIHTYFDRMEKIKAKTIEKIKILAIDEKFKSEFILGFDNAYNSNKPLMERFKNNQLALAIKFREVLLFASKTSAKLSETNQPLFGTEEELNYYNTIIEEVKKLAMEEEQITKEIQILQETNKKKLEMIAK